MTRRVIEVDERPPLLVTIPLSLPTQESRIASTAAPPITQELYTLVMAITPMFSP